MRTKYTVEVLQGIWTVAAVTYDKARAYSIALEWSTRGYVAIVTETEIV